MSKVNRQTVDLSGYPELIVIYLGMRVNVWTGLKTLIGLGPQIAKSVADRPDGLLRHEDILFSLFPPHLGMRQYWRDFESLEAWSRSDPHRKWWQNFLKDSGGAGFWHETYAMQGGMEAIYDDIPKKIGLMAFAPVMEARGPAFTSRQRISRDASAATTTAAPSPVGEEELYPE